MRKLLIAFCLLAVHAGRGVASESPSWLLSVPAEFQDESGKPVTLDAWRGKPVVLSMFYTTCQLKCGKTVDVMKDLEERYAARGNPVDFVLITMDPENDSLHDLKRYRKRKGLSEENWHLLRAGQTATDTLAAKLRYNTFDLEDHLLHDFRIFVLGTNGVVEHVIEWDTKLDDLFPEADASAPSGP